MKQPESLQLVEAGTLLRPGPIGRLVRLLAGAACVYALYELTRYHDSIIQTPVSVLANIAVMLIISVLLIKDVVNIGFGRNWGRWPSYIMVGSTFLAAAIAWPVFGTADHALPGTVLWLWMMYFFAHLGISFLLSAALATPGCEMRAIPQVVGLLRGRSFSEHPCPAFLEKIDEWERSRKRAS